MFRKYLLPIVSLISSISQIHYIEKNQSVGYNRGFVATKKTKIGIVPIGHADGIPRSLGNRKGKLLVNNIKCDIIGNVCMDMLMIDITGMDCNEGDQVVMKISQSTQIQFHMKFLHQLLVELREYTTQISFK
jgi:alanine racemase